MNMREPDHQSPPPADAIGDQNVERLLTNAYQPEMLDPEFVERVHARALAAAKEVRHPSKSSPAHATPAGPIDKRTKRLWLMAVSISLAIVLIVGRFITSKVDHYPDGELIWINGRPYAPATSGSSGGGPKAVHAPVL